MRSPGGPPLLPHAGSTNSCSGRSPTGVPSCTSQIFGDGCWADALLLAAPSENSARHIATHTPLIPANAGIQGGRHKVPLLSSCVPACALRYAHILRQPAALMLRRARSARLEAWPRTLLVPRTCHLTAPNMLPCFETRPSGAPQHEV